MTARGSALRPRQVTRALRAVPGVRQAALRLRLSDLTRTEPLSSWGSDRPGGPVDRWYIERFLRDHASVVRGRVLEVKADHYASSLGADRVDVVDIDPANPHATLVGDLCLPGTLPPSTYDGAIVTQTLQLVPDPVAAVRHLHACLRPGGTLLLTVPALSRLVDDGDKWRWTPYGFRALLAAALGDRASYDVVGMGNGLAARAFLFGLGAGDLDPAVLARPDDRYPLVVGAVVRADAP